MNLLNGKNVLTIGQDETVSFIKEKAGLSERMARLVIEIFSFMIKKKILEYGKLQIFCLGTFFLKIYRKRNRLRKYNVVFFTSDDFKEAIKGERKPSFIIKQAYVLRPNLIEISNMLGVKLNDVKYLFALYSYCIIVNLLKYNEYKILKLGRLMIIDRPSLKYKGISQKYNGDVNTKLVVFRFSATGISEINRRRKTITVCKRLKRMFYFSKIDRTIKPKPYFIDDNEVPKAIQFLKRDYINDCKKTK